MTAPGVTGGPVDVLAVMDRARDVLVETYAKYQTKIGPFASQSQQSNVELRQARAAVAELIEALGEVPERQGAPITSEEWARDDENLGFSHAFFGRAIRSCRSGAYERGLEKGRRLRVALARCGGDK